MTDGTLAWGNGSFPLNRCILGGEEFHHGDEYIVTLTEAHEIPAVATALQQVTEAFMRQAYDRVDPAEYGPNWSEEDLEYTWDWFQDVRDLWSRALRRLVGALVMQAMRSSVPAATSSADSPA